MSTAVVPAEILNGVVMQISKTIQIQHLHGTATQITGQMADRGRPLPLLAQVKQAAPAALSQLH
ncbi:MAG: hypothetical protein EBS97_09330 [Verrucomicrobia bacterium]|nr:hypothetical protein [Verrucomicrobiota bacterium]